MSWLILKGEGVWYRDKDGVMHFQTLPPPDSDYKNISHFHINTKTGKPFEELEGQNLIGRWPMEIAARIMARELMKNGYVDETGAKKVFKNEVSALQKAHKVFNNATMKFNKTKRAAGDDFHTLEIPFDANGNLHPEYKDNHYGGFQDKAVPTSQRVTRSQDGRLINNHPRNEIHPEFGQHLESAALHIGKELQEEAKTNGFSTVIGAVQNCIEPQHITNGVTHRYSSADDDPRKKGNTKYPSHYDDLHNQSAAYGKITAADIVSVLPNDFFIPSTSGNMATETAKMLQDKYGYDQPTARALARSPVNQLVYGSGKEGRETTLNKVIRNLRAKLGVDSDETVHSMYAKHLSHVAPDVSDSGKNGRGNATAKILALLKLSEQLQIDPNSISLYNQTPQEDIVQQWRSIATKEGGQPVDMEALGSVDEHHPMRGKFSDENDHVYREFPEHLSGSGHGQQLPVEPVAPLDAMSEPPPVSDEVFGLQPPGLGFEDLSQFNPFPEGREDIQLSNDDPMGVIANIMERVQLHDAGGSLLVKYDPMDSYDMLRLGHDVGMSSLDVRAIAMSLGDWNVIAKSFNTTHDVVRAIKRSCGGALNG